MSLNFILCHVSKVAYEAASMSLINTRFLLLDQGKRIKHGGWYLKTFVDITIRQFGPSIDIDVPFDTMQVSSEKKIYMNCIYEVTTINWSLVEYLHSIDKIIVSKSNKLLGEGNLLLSLFDSSQRTLVFRFL